MRCLGRRSVHAANGLHRATWHPRGSRHWGAEADLSDLAVDNGHLSVAGRDLAELPAAVAARFGEQVTSLDLSFNALRCGPAASGVGQGPPLGPW